MATKMELAAQSLKLAQKEGYKDFRTTIKSINTGSHVYTIYGIYSVGRDIMLSVTKYKTNNQLVGRLIIDKIHDYDLEYNKAVIGTLPDSVVKTIKQFIIIYNNDKNMNTQYIVKISGEIRKHTYSIISDSPKNALIDSIIKIDNTYSKNELDNLIKDIHYDNVDTAFYQGYIIAEVLNKSTCSNNYYACSLAIDNKR